MLLFSLNIPLSDTFVSIVELISELIMKSNDTDSTFHHEFLLEFLISNNSKDNNHITSSRIRLFLYIIIQQCSLPNISINQVQYLDNEEIEERNDYRITEIRYFHSFHSSIDTNDNNYYSIIILL